MKYYWVINGAIIEEFDNFETAYRILEAKSDVFQSKLGENSLLVAKKDVTLICSEEYNATHQM